MLANDKDLIERLLKIAQDSEQKTRSQQVNQAYQAQQAQKTQQESKELAKKLVVNLKKQLEGKSFFTAEKDNAELRPAHLVDLDALLNFLSLNKLKYNEAYLVINTKFDAAISSNLKEIDEAKYLKYENFLVYKDGLIAYLRNLQSKNIPILNTMVAKLIDSANQLLKLNLSKDHPTPTRPAVGVAGSEAPTVGDPTPVGSQTGKVQPGQETVNTTEIVNQIVASLPLKLHDINFNRINAFLELYGKLTKSLPQNNSMFLVSAASQIKSKMEQIGSKVDPMYRISFPIQNVSPQLFETYIKAPTGNFAVDVILLLTQIIALVNDIVNQFYEAYFDFTSQNDRNAQRDSGQKELVFQQSAIFRSNNEELSRLKGQVISIINRKI